MDLVLGDPSNSPFLAGPNLQPAEPTLPRVPEGRARPGPRQVEEIPLRHQERGSRAKDSLSTLVPPSPAPALWPDYGTGRLASWMQMESGRPHPVHWHRDSPEPALCCQCPRPPAHL